MERNAESVQGFPHARIRSASGGLPVEVFLIAQLGHGAGDRLHAQAAQRQRAHAGFIDALDEPSARLAAPDFERGDATALYTFAVGPQGHPFHRHAGHRVFTAVTGSGGALLRFSSASDAQIAADPRNFLHALHQVRLPPDCLFTVRFGDGVWHQFAPVKAGSTHPVFFALSCHTNELGGPLSVDARQQVLAGDAHLATLTELLPASVQALLTHADLGELPTMHLSLEASPDSPLLRLCERVRGVLGRLRTRVGTWTRNAGFIAGRQAHVVSLQHPPADSLLRAQLSEGFHHEDMVAMTIAADGITTPSARAVLGAVLDGFLSHRPAGVSVLMALRNQLVRPLRLRTSPLGCPVSSLLSTQSEARFLGRHPVRAHTSSPDDRHAQVVLGADDRHLQFRSCVAVRWLDDQRIEISLGTRVRCSNLFGHVYLRAIDAMHRRYVAPTMLRAAVEALVQQNRSLSLCNGLFA